MSPRYTDNIADIIIQNSDLISIISEYIQLKKTGRNVKGLCPFHNEKSPSFVVSEEKQLYHCFGCGAGGSVIQFIMQIENLDFIDALELIAEKSHIDLSQYETTSTNRPNRKDNDDLIEMTREAAIFFYKQLRKEGNPAIDYLTNRGIDQETVRSFGLGYAPLGWDNLIKHLKSKNYTEKLMEKSGLVVKRDNSPGYYDRFRERVMFPIMDVRGRIIAFGGRVLDDSNPKYLNSPESSIFDKSNTLYGLNIAKKMLTDSKQIIVVEGYMDVISLHRKGIQNVVATLGTALTKSHGSLLKRYANEAIIAYDSDEAGQKATIRSLDILESTGLKVRVFDMLDTKDPDEFVVKYGQEKFHDQVNRSLTSIEFKLKLVRVDCDFKTNDGRIKYIKEAINILKKLKSDSEKSIYAGKLAEEMNIDRNAIESEIMTSKKQTRNTQDTQRQVSNVTMKSILSKAHHKKSPNMSVEKKLLQLMSLGRATFNKLWEQIDAEWIYESTTQKCIGYLNKYYQYEEDVVVDKLIDHMDMEDIAYLKNIIETKIPILDVNKEIELVTIQLKTLFLEKKIRELRSEITSGYQNITLDNREDTAIIERMLNEYILQLAETKKRMQRQ